MKLSDTISWHNATIYRYSEEVGAKRTFSSVKGSAERTTTLPWVKWRNDDGRWSDTLKLTTFLAFLVRLWASFVVCLKKCSVVRGLLTVVSLRESMGLGNGHRLDDKSTIRWTLLSKSLGFLRSSRTTVTNLSNLSLSKTGHGRPEIGVSRAYLREAVRRLRKLSSDEERISGCCGKPGTFGNLKKCKNMWIKNR